MLCIYIYICIHSYIYICIYRAIDTRIMALLFLGVEQEPREKPQKKQKEIPQDLQRGTPLTLTGAFDGAMGAVGSKKSTVNRRGDAMLKTTRWKAVSDL